MMNAEDIELLRVVMKKIEAAVGGVVFVGLLGTDPVETT